MIRFTRKGIVLAALLSTAAPAIWADPISYLTLSAQLHNIELQGAI